MNQATIDESPHKDKVLLFMPNSEESSAASTILTAMGAMPVECNGKTDFCNWAEEEADVLILSEELLDANTLLLLGEKLHDQPAWSEVPVLLIAPNGGESKAAAAAMQLFNNVLLLNGPLNTAAVRSAIRMALQTRRRQRQIRSMLNEQRHQKSELVEKEHSLQKARTELQAQIRDSSALLRQRSLELEATTAKNRALSRKNLEMLEGDRRFVARELHDRIGGSLAAIKHLLEEIKNYIDPHDLKRATPLNKAIGHLADTIRESKRFSARLRPLALEELGLISTIEAFTRHFGEFYTQIGINQHLEITEENIPDALKIILYRILQEAMNNAAKHSHADRITICLKAYKGRIVFEVADNGRGFDIEKVFATQNLGRGGLQNMQERTEAAGGRLTILSQPGKGTRIVAVFPDPKSL